MKIEILCTGDEILSGKTINTNYSHIARRLVEHGFEVVRGTTVGDDRKSLVAAFQQASRWAEAVIVNGGLGPTVDDLSQEAAASAAGVELVLHQGWYERIAAWYKARGRKMPENNKKQAMLPEGAEFIDNPIGTACGFAMDIGNARFYFTPGVPGELHRMLDEQIIPRLQKIRGKEIFTRVKRFHTFGIGESRADQMLDGVEEIVPEHRVKLGFQSHYPQLETKLTAQDDNEESLDKLLQPVEAAVRERLGNFVICEDSQTMESNILQHLESIGGSVSVGETFSAGKITSRLLSVPDYSERVRRGIISLDYREIADFLGLDAGHGMEPGPNQAVEVAEQLRISSGASHGLAVLVSLIPGDESGTGAGDVFIGISDGESVESRVARLPGHPGWIRAGASEMGLDCLRRFLFGQPVHEMIDFEQH